MTGSENQNKLKQVKYNGYSGDNGIHEEEMTKTPRSIRLFTCVLTFCVTCNVLMISVTVHFGIENHKRLREYEKLSKQVRLLEMKIYQMKQDRNGKVNFPTTTSTSPPSPLVEALKNATTRSQPSEKPVVKRNSVPATTETPKIKENPAINECLLKVEKLELRHDDLWEKLEFVKNQLFQRLALVEETIGSAKRSAYSDSFTAFSVAFGSENSATFNDNDKTIRFEQVTMNKGSAYDDKTGYFTAPTAGTYFFHTMIVASLKSRYASNSYSTESCQIKLRKNKKTIPWLSTLVECVIDDFTYDCDVKGSLTPIIRLEQNDIVDVTMTGRCNPYSNSIFQGFFLHT